MLWFGWNEVEVFFSVVCFPGKEQILKFLENKVKNTSPNTTLWILHNLDWNKVRNLERQEGHTNLFPLLSLKAIKRLSDLHHPRVHPKPFINRSNRNKTATGKPALRPCRVVQSIAMNDMDIPSAQHIPLRLPTSHQTYKHNVTFNLFLWVFLSEDYSIILDYIYFLLQTVPCYQDVNHELWKSQKPKGITNF